MGRETFKSLSVREKQASLAKVCNLIQKLRLFRKLEKDHKLRKLSI